MRQKNPAEKKQDRLIKEEIPWMPMKCKIEMNKTSIMHLFSLNRQEE